MKESVETERRLRLEAEQKLRCMSDVPIETVRPPRRSHSPPRPHIEGEPEDILDIKSIQVTQPNWVEVRNLLEKYQEIKVLECHESTAQVAEDVDGNASTDRREEK